MGKKQLGELQPFEFVITMAIADLACMPMQDIAVPLVYGLVPLFVMFLLHFAFTWLATKSVKFRKFLNGKPIVVVTPEGIDSESMAKLNFTINDLLESIRSQQFFSVEQIKYAVLETNGNLSILENSSAPEPSGIPVTLVVEGRKMSTNFDYAGVDDEFVENYVANKNLKIKSLLSMGCTALVFETADGRILKVSPYNHFPDGRKPDDFDLPAFSGKSGYTHYYLQEKVSQENLSQSELREFVESIEKRGYYLHDYTIKKVDSGNVIEAAEEINPAQFGRAKNGKIYLIDPECATLSECKSMLGGLGKKLKRFFR